MLICDELFLLLTKDSGTPEVWGGKDLYGLRGALLADLALHQRLTVEEGRNPRFHILDTTPTGHPAMDQALEVLPGKDGKRLSSLISWSRLDPRPGIVSSLSSAGVITVSKGGLLGMRTTYPTVDAEPEQALRQRLYAVLHAQAVPTQADRTLLAIIQGLGQASTILPRQHTGLSGRDLKRRITELTKGDQAGDAVSRTVEMVDAAVVAALIVPTTVAATS